MLVLLAFGLETRVHCVPSQCSITVTSPPVPTAQIVFAEMAATPFKEVVDERGVGVGNDAPPRSVVVFNEGLIGPEPEVPTAHTSLAAIAATPVNELALPRLGVG